MPYTRQHRLYRLTRKLGFVQLAIAVNVVLLRDDGKTLTYLSTIVIRRSRDQLHLGDVADQALIVLLGNRGFGNLVKTVSLIIFSVVNAG